MTEQKHITLAGRKIMIAIPAYDGKLNISGAFQLPNLALSAAKHGFEIHLAHLSGCSIITRARNSLVNQFLETDCTEMLFIDADINFTQHDILRIMALGGDKDIVAGAYPRRAKDQMFFADIHYNEYGGIELTEDGLMRVNRIGTGFMYIRRHVIETLRDEHPEWKYWVDVEQKHHYAIFDFAVTKEGYMGEDYLFCDRARAHGFKIYIDPEINLGHFGSTEFTGHFGKQVLQPMIERTMSQMNQGKEFA
ncbi:MAG: hypothetical protein RL563_2153 [Pseudomonadota bacterium]|jgi:hypothetical protein